MIRPEHQCEAKIDYKTTQQAQSRINYDLYGKRIDLGRNFKEVPGIEEVFIACERCELPQVVFQAEGPGFAAYNEARRIAKGYLQENCKKWRQAGHKEMPQNYHPNVSNSNW